ncbi:MAG TPA: zinc-binding alcohol dehydrogenase family protein [Ilumatobacteraceae bacterium]
MRAARLHEIGGTLQLDEVPDPRPGPDERLVDIAYASVNPLDVWISQGSIGAAANNLPWIPGSEASGSVDGKPVLIRGGGLGVARHGLFRDKVAVPDAWLLPVDPNLDLAQVAAMPVAGITAWRSLHARGDVQRDDRVLVLGASGGVGAVAVQLAKAAGATVWGQTGTAAKIDGIRNNGADDVIVTGADDLLAAAEGFQPTLVLDSLGGPYTDAAIGAMANKGRIVVYGTSNDERISMNLRRLYRKGITMLGYAGLVDTPEEQREALDTLLAMMADGSLHIPVGEILPLSSAADAFARILNRGAQGKIVLDCSK